MRTPTPEQRVRIAAYRELLRRWNRTINLVGANAIGVEWDRHVNDALAVGEYLPGSGHFIDLGTGAGLPGVILAIMATPDQHWTLIEADKRKVAFLATVRRILGLRLKLINRRIEATAPVGASVITARALAPLPDLLAHQMRHGAVGSIGLYLKGARWAEEVRLAETRYTFHVDDFRPAGGEGPLVLRVSKLRAHG